MIDEDDIFKSLSHNVRRDIIRIVGSRKEITFSEILKALNSKDSSTLSYHLRNLQPLIKQVDKEYSLSEVGQAALNLLEKTSQSQKISRYKKKFLYAYLVTVICWVSVAILIPFIYLSDINSEMKLGLIQFMVTTISWSNFVILWSLKKRD